ncbi:hypothetical protein D0Z07_3661 [Hyphodiscus hymeniophilus]|uniref:BZIP domain-containing protein n=1 Tax=Hyphodiscus hymeniophilus TaxID=353542 RepID=A0A9P7AY63_9HELO|nr:hypothetical protein D0Z07_3661 [Hyphodiscus hymeniophilus]
MDPSYNFPPDDYALTILTQAAMHTNHHNHTESPNHRPAFEPQPVSSQHLPSRGLPGPITNHQTDDDINILRRIPQVPRRKTPDIFGDFNPAVLSGRSMETLAFNPTAASGQMPYMNQAYRGIGSQISQNYANSLGILNAESYDDARGALRAREASDMRLKHNEPTMPFGITSGPKITLDSESRVDSEDVDAGSRRRKKPRIETHSGDDDDEARKKSRGRPRVDPKDETPADRRRTQIRMAQRAYRHRKETTISSLEKRVEDLKATNEEMSNIFISLYDFAAGKGLLDREPEFSRQLQSTTERFLALAKTAEDLEDNHGDDGEKHEEEGESGSGKPKGRRASPKKRKAPTPPPVSDPSNSWGGYTLSKEDSPIEDIDLGYHPDQQYRTREDLQIITRPTEENASFPFDLMDLQNYRVEIPQIEDYSQNFFPHQLPLPSSYSYHEFSFARRIHRGAVEMGLRLLATADPEDERLKRTFGFSLLYESKEAIEARLKRIHNASTKETLSEWRAPFVHVGGSGTYYPMADNDVNGDLVPKFRTGYSMGPFSSKVSQAQEALDDDMKCNLPGFEGEFFDSNDVEGYLRGHGLDIPPAADFVSGEVDLLALTEMSSPKSYNSDTITSLPSPRTPRSPIENILFDEDNFPFGNSDSTMALPKSRNQMANTLPYPLAYDSWENNKSMDEDLIDPSFSAVAEQNDVRAKTPEIVISDARFGEKRTVTVNVTILLEGLALYRALLEQCTRVPLPNDLPLAGPVNPLKHLIRKRFKKDVPISSPRLAVNALKVGYAAEQLLRIAGDGSSPALSKVHTLLRLRASRSTASRLICKLPPPRETPDRVGPYPGAPKLLDVRPLPLEQLSGRRHVPGLTHANGYPFLRTRKPQSPFLSRVLREKIAVKDKRHKKMQNLDTEVDHAKNEASWEKLIDELAEREGRGRDKPRKRQTEESWEEEPLKTKERLKFLIYEDLHKAKKMGDKMIEIVEREKTLWRHERMIRKAEKKAAKRKGKGTEESDVEEW